MSPDKINSWLALGANFGVLIGLIILIIEIGQNTDMTRAQIIQARADFMASTIDARMNSEYWPELIAKKRSANSTEEWIESLSPADLERVRMSYRQDTNYLQHLFYQNQEGFVPPEMWTGPIRRQFIRHFELIKVFQGPICDRMEPYYVFLRELAQEEGVAECGEDGRYN
jgi:hypothetical protein